MDTYDNGNMAPAPVNLLRHLGIAGPLTFAQARAEYEASQALYEATAVFTDEITLGRLPTDAEAKAHETAHRHRSCAFENFVACPVATVEQMHIKAKVLAKMADIGGVADRHRNNVTHQRTAPAAWPKWAHSARAAC
jgi:hypothetical protein